MSDQRKQRLRSALPFALALVPAVFIALCIRLYGVDHPLWDEWIIGRYLEKFSQGTLSVHDLFKQQNEYRQFFPNLIFVALGWWTSWDVRYWMALSFLLAGLISFSIYHLGKWTLRKTPARAGWACFIANLIIFSPVQHENWLQGQQLVYFLPIACLTASLLVASAADLRTGTRFSLCAAASIVASFSSANGMLCWILLLPVLAWSSSRVEMMRMKWWIAAWLAGFLATVGLYFHGYNAPAHHDPFALVRNNPLRIVVYFLAALGRPLSPGRLFIAASVGLALLLLFIWSCLRFWKLQKSSGSQPRRLLAWLMLGAYSILTAALITFGRLEHDLGRDLAPTRYTTFTLYLPVALVYLLSSLVGRSSRQLRLFNFKVTTARLLAILGVVVIAMHVPIYLLGIRQMSSFRVLSLQAKACSLFVNVLGDDCLTAKVHPNIDFLKRVTNPADRLGLIRPGLIKSNRVLDIATAPELSANKSGAFQSLVRLKNGEYVASGWAYLADRGEPADSVLLAYSEEGQPAIIFALAMLSTERDMVSALLGRGIHGNSGWSKSFLPETVNFERARISAWGFDAYTGKIYKLDGEHVFEKSAVPN